MSSFNLDARERRKEVASFFKQVEDRLAALERPNALNQASIEGGALDIYDEEGTYKGSIGVQLDGAVALVPDPENSEPPPTPTAPTVEAALAGLVIGWDGSWADAEAPPTDFALVQVHVGTAVDFTPDATTQIATITDVTGGTVTVHIEGFDLVWVRLVAMNTAALTGDPSDAVQGQARKAVSDDLIDGIVTELKLAAEAVTAAKLAVGAVNTTALADGAVLAEKLAANAVTQSKLADKAVTALALADAAVTQAKVAVGAIGAGQMAIGAGNLAPDPSFEGAYTAQLISARPDWAQVTPGNGSPTALRVDCTSGVTTWKNVELARFPVLAGERHYLAFDFKTSATFNGAGVKFMLRYEDNAGTILNYGVTEKAFTPGSSWARATGQVQAPTGATTAVLMVEASQCSAGQVWFDNAEVSTLVVAGKVAAGSVTATEIAALTIQAGNIAANAIAAGKIDVDAVTTRELAANAVTASEISAGAVTANALAAGSVTTDKLTVAGGANLLSDPSFEGAFSAALVNGNPVFSIDATKGNGSAKSLKVNAVAGVATTRSLQITTVPVLAGDQLFLAVDYLTSADYTPSAIVKFYARWEDSSGATVGFGVAQASPPVLGGSTWPRITATATAPANTVRASIWAESFQASAGTVWWDNAAVRPVVAGVQIADGAITTPKMVANSIQGDRIAAGTMNADRLVAQSITTSQLGALSVTANELAANAVTATKILAGSIDATHIKAGSISADRLTIISSTNMLPDPSFEGAGGAALVAGQTYWTIANTGNGSAKSIQVNAVNPTSVIRTLTLGVFPILPGQQLRLATDVNPSTDWNGSSVRIYARWIDQAGNVTFGFVTNTTPTKGAWSNLAGTVTAPAGTVSVEIRLASYDATTGNVLFDNSVVQPVVGGVQIADGAITANKLDANAINGKTITGVTVTGTSTITGALIRSAPSSNRVEISSTPVGGTAEVDLYTETASDSPGGIIAFGASSGGRALALNAPAKSGVTDTPQVFLEYVNSDTKSSIVLSASYVQATGVFTAGNIVAGHVSITPSAPNTPTSITVTGLGLIGANPRAVATATTAVPGTTVTGVGITDLSNNSMTVWVSRTNTTSTGIDYFAIASQ